MPRRAALPERTPTQAALDHLTDPGHSGATGNVVTSVTTQVTPAQVKRTRGGSEHVRLPRTVVDELRDAVWYWSEHGRPRVTLVEILEEAAVAWLEQSKAEATGGTPFPHRGALR